MLYTAETFEGAIDHDSQPRAQGLTLFHAVRSENNTSTFLYDTSQDIPEVASCGGIHASGWLIQQNDGRIANQSYGCAQLTFVPTTAVHSGIMTSQSDSTARVV